MIPLGLVPYYFHLKVFWESASFDMRAQARRAGGRGRALQAACQENRPSIYTRAQARAGAGGRAGARVASFVPTMGGFCHATYRIYLSGSSTKTKGGAGSKSLQDSKYPQPLSHTNLHLTPLRGPPQLIQVNRASTSLLTLKVPYRGLQEPVGASTPVRSNYDFNGR